MLAAEPDDTPSARLVIGPTMPSATRPWARWNAFTARCVCGPKTPSAEIPRRRCSACTAAPLEPRRRLRFAVEVDVDVDADAVAVPAAPTAMGAPMEAAASAT